MPWAPTPPLHQADVQPFWVFPKRAARRRFWRKGLHVELTHTKGWHVDGIKTPRTRRATLLPIWPTCHPFGDFRKFRHPLDVPPFFSNRSTCHPFGKKGGTSLPWEAKIKKVGTSSLLPTRPTCYLFGEISKGWDVELVVDQADVQPFSPVAKKGSTS